MRIRNHVLDNRDLKAVDYLRAHLYYPEEFNLNTIAIDSLLLPLPPTFKQKHEIVPAFNVKDRELYLDRRRRAGLDERFNALLNKLMTGELRLGDFDLPTLSAVK